MGHTLDHVQIQSHRWGYQPDLNDVPVMLPAASKLPRLEEIPDGCIVLIRFIRSDCQLDIFTERFEVPSELVYCYVKAVIDTSLQTLEIYLGEDFVTSYLYAIPMKEKAF